MRRKMTGETRLRRIRTFGTKTLSEIRLVSDSKPLYGPPARLAAEPDSPPGLP